MKKISHHNEQNRPKSEPCRPDTIIIPELELAAERYQLHKFVWSDDDIATLKKYYGRVPIQKLEKYLHRSTLKIHEKAAELGMKRAGRI